MRIGVPKEFARGERRVALVPEVVRRLTEAGMHVTVERGAGSAAGFRDAGYEAAGATLADDIATLWADADAVLKVQPPSSHPALDRHEADLPREGAVVIGMLRPLSLPDLARRLADRRVTGVAMELVPRVTRAQGMDALSSQSTVAGYKAVLMAADRIGKFLPMLVTAAGTVAPARVLVIGAGVAGLQAVATARRLGAVVEAFDIRPAVREQVESLGATFVGLGLDEAEGEGGYAQEVSEDVHRREQELLAERVAAADVVVTTALVPGKPAPVLVTEEMLDAMRPGSVIVDLAAEAGGNCAATRADEETERDGVLVLGPTNLPADLPQDASRMYARNIAAMVEHLRGDDGIGVDLDDEIVGACVVAHDGRIVNERVRSALGVRT